MFNFFSTFEKFTVQLQELINKIMLMSGKLDSFSSTIQEVLVSLENRVNTDIDINPVRSITFSPSGMKYINVEMYKEDDIVYVVKDNNVIAYSTETFTCEV